MGKKFRKTPHKREGFRETFLVHFTRRGDGAALRRLGFLFSELYMSAAPRWWPDHPEGKLRAMVGAAVLDLRHLRDVLSWLDRSKGDYSMEASALAGLARRCGEELEDMASLLEDAMAHPARTLERESALLDKLLGVEP